MQDGRRPQFRPGVSRGRDMAAARPASAGEPDVWIRLDGSLDHLSRRRLHPAIAEWIALYPAAPFASVAHLDLTGVTHLAAAGLDLLNELHARMSAAGWLVRITPPSDVDSRVAFHRAAIRRQLRWA